MALANHRSPTRQIACSEGKTGSASHVYVRSSGACRHIVADRLDITGARWGLEGAEAILKLRALRSNRDFDAYWQYHLAATWPKNAAESTSPDTPITSSRKRPDVPPREPHPIGSSLCGIGNPTSTRRCSAVG